jgi:CRP/FNR family transcriptional regulator
VSGAGWIARFPALAAMGEADRALLERSGRIVELPAGHVVFRPGEPCAHFLLVLDGSVRVHLVSRHGREIVLYRVGAGETCVLTTAGLLGTASYEAEGTIERPTRAVALPRGPFVELLGRSAPFREFVFATYGERLTEIMVRLQEVAFESIDRRLAAKLLERADDAGEVVLTHQELATELGTAREVVTRHLRELARSGAVSLARGRIAITDAASLRSQVAADPG